MSSRLWQGCRRLHEFQQYYARCIFRRMQYLTGCRRHRCANGLKRTRSRRSESGPTNTTGEICPWCRQSAQHRTRPRQGGSPAQQSQRASSKAMQLMMKGCPQIGVGNHWCRTGSRQHRSKPRTLHLSKQPYAMFDAGHGGLWRSQPTTRLE